MNFDGMNSAPSQGEVLDVAVLLGGESSERDISLASGICVAAALEASGHHVAAFDPTDGDLFGINWSQFDVCYVALHGGAGEGGLVQRDLEELAIPYTGSGPVASRLALSKMAAKERFAQHDVPTPEAICFRASKTDDPVVPQFGSLGFPVVIKPDGQGSSLGLGLARSPEEVASCIDAARAYESCLVAERLIEGREFTVAVLDRQPLPALEILPTRTLFDAEDKLGRQPAASRFPERHLSAQVENVAVEAAEALGTRGLVRVDLMLDRQGQPWVLEVNTIPGMTERSIVPRIARQAGMSMPQLCDHLVRACIAEAVLA